MPYTTGWYIKDRVIAVRLHGEIQIGDIEGTAREMLQLIEESQEVLVHALIDVHEMTGFPLNLLAISKASSAIASHPRLGWAIHYGTDSRLLKYFSGMVAQMFKVRFRLVDNRQEALRVLYEREPSLPPQDVTT